jgi:hypothetical protein
MVSAAALVGDRGETGVKPSGGTGFRSCRGLSLIAAVVCKLYAMQTIDMRSNVSDSDVTLVRA